MPRYSSRFYLKIYLNKKWISLKLLEGNEKLVSSIETNLKINLHNDQIINEVKNKPLSLKNSLTFLFNIIRKTFISYYPPPTFCL